MSTGALLRRIAMKLQQSAAFLRHSNTPVPLILDSFKLYRRPFVAESGDGIRLEITPRARESFTFYENLIRRDYLQHGIRIEAGDCVVDIGANIGAFTVLAAKLVGPSGRVLAIEPASSTFAKLARNIELNGAVNVTAIRAAIGASDGKAELHLSDRSAFATLHRVKDIDFGQTESVEVVTLESVMQKYSIRRIQLLKMDCEGGEYEILESMQPETAQKIEKMAFEVHAVHGRDPAEIHRRLKELGFRTAGSTYPLVAFRS